MRRGISIILSHTPTALPSTHTPSHSDLAFITIIAHEHYYLVVFNLSKGDYVIIDNSKSAQTYDTNTSKSVISWPKEVKTKPIDDKEKELWVELKRLFKPDNDDILWKLQRYMHDPLVWRLYDTCGVPYVSSVRGHDIFMLVEKEYSLTKGTLGLMMVARLLVEADSEMSRELLRKIFYQANRPMQ
ncbi:hypothetical protein Tco_0201417 [Tanacetum coccineum]